jgi:NAD(P)H dehydrogenase (quinone)
VGVRKKMENKVGAAFATAGDPTGGKETTIFSIIQALMIYGMIIVGDPLAATGHYGTACVGTPDDTTLENARLLGARVARLASRLID